MGITYGARVYGGLFITHSNNRFWNPKAASLRTGRVSAGQRRNVPSLEPFHEKPLEAVEELIMYDRTYHQSNQVHWHTTV